MSEKIVTKKCKICGLSFDYHTDITYQFQNGIDDCPYCKEIIKLRDIISDYYKKQNFKFWEDRTTNKHFKEDGIRYGNGVKSYTLASYDRNFVVTNRTKRVKKIIEKIEKIRNYMYLHLDAYIEILESCFEKKDIFWSETGNISYFLIEAAKGQVVIILSDLISKSPKCKNSIHSLINIIKNDLCYIERQEIIERYKYKDDGEISDQKFDRFEFEKYFEQIERINEDLSNSLLAIKDYRDNLYAHIGELKEESSKNMSYAIVKRVCFWIKTILDGLYAAVAPDKCSTVIVDHNLRFEHLNRICELYKKKEQEEREKLRKYKIDNKIEFK